MPKYGAVLKTATSCYTDVGWQSCFERRGLTDFSDNDDGVSTIMGYSNCFSVKARVSVLLALAMRMRRQYDDP